MIYFSDVDVVVKLAACGFLSSLAALLNVEETEIAVKHLASLKARAKRLPKAEQRDALVDFCQRHKVVGDEADIARMQSLIDGGMDPGEALLFAEAEATGGTVVTGDKRALAAYANLSTAAQRAKICVVCWEQLLLRAIHVLGYEAMRKGCCENLECDKLLGLVFSNGLATTEEHAATALRSYLGGVKKHSSDILKTFDPDL